MREHMAITVQQAWVSLLNQTTGFYHNTALPKLSGLPQQVERWLAFSPFIQRLRYLVRFYPQAMAVSTLAVTCVLGLLTTCAVQAALGSASKVAPTAMQATALSAGKQALVALGRLAPAKNTPQQEAFAFLAQSLTGKPVADNTSLASAYVPNYGRQDPFKPLVKSTEEPPPVIIDPCEGVSFIGFIQGDKKTPDVAILELMLPGSTGSPVTVVKPLGTVVEHNGFSLKLVRGNAQQLSVSVNGSTRTLSLVPVVDNVAAAGSSTGGAPDPNANPNLGGQPGDKALLKDLKE
jgi:hypothetical protein